MRLLKHEDLQSSVEGVCAEEELKEFGREFQTLFNLMPDPVVIVDGKGKFLAVNDKVEEKTGFSKQELLGKNFLRTGIATAKSKAILIKNLAKRMMGMNIEPYEVEVLSKDGQKIFAEVNARKIEYEGKLADLVIFRDITERKKAEEALRESEAKFRNLAEQSPNMIFINKKGRVVYANKKCEEIMGYKREKFYSPDFSFLTLIAPESVDLVKSNFSRHTKGEEVAPYEYRLVTKEGKKIEAIITPKLIRYEGESAILGIITDITERKKMERKLHEYAGHLEEMVEERTRELKKTQEALRESEERLRQLIEYAPDAIYVNDLDGNFIDGNRQAEKMVGYKREELIGKNMFEVGLLPEKYLPKAMEGLEKNIHGQRSGPEEFELVRKDGSTITVEISSFPVKRGGKVECLGIARDITERKKMEERLFKSERLATIGEVATMVGHDLRNPLQSIENATYYLNNELPRLPPSTPIPQKVIKMLQVINDSVNYADMIIRDLKDFSATKKPILTKTNINTIVKETLSQVEALENVELITELGRLPKIKADKDMIKRAFLNIAMNGIQAIENGGTLKVSTKKTKGFIEISFKDTGAGMPKENVKKLFTPLFTTKARGMGMGLAICKKFVEIHGGSIEVESEEGKGSTFTVKLPIQKENGGENQ